MSNNVQTVSAIYEAFGRGDIPAILAKVADDVRWEAWPDNSAQKAGVSWMKEQRGRDGVAAFFQGLTALRILSFEVLGILDGGDRVAAPFVIEAEVVATGRRFRDEEMHLWTFDASGKVTGLRHYIDTAKHIAAAGL